MKNLLRWLTIVLCVPLFADRGIAQVAPLIANIDGRQATDLDGQWQAIVDPYDVGAFDYRGKPLTNNNAFYKNHKPQSLSELVEYDFDTSGQLNVPGDWNTQRPSLLFYEGSIWYKRTFNYSKSPKKRVFVHFGAANYLAAVYLNGEELGHHEGGFTPFDFEVTDGIRPQDNFLVLRVNNTRGKDLVPTDNTDWWNYGGITRPVTLVEVPQTFIQDYFIQLAKGSTRRVAGWLQLNGPQLRQKVTIRIPEAGITNTVETDSTGLAEFSFDASLTLWSPENPKLYTVEIAGETDKIADRIGFRSIETRGTDILLNGKSIFLRGVSIHEEAPMRSGRAWTEDDARTLLGWAKELGCNFVRLAHYPHNEAMLRVADQMGLLVWGEVPVYWTIEWENPKTLHNAENQLNELITRDHNRASLIIYSVANETPTSEARNRFLHQLIQQAHSTDPTRLVSAALQAEESIVVNHITITINDPIAADLDVLGNNEYIGWYVHQPADADAIDWVSNYGKPLIMSEFGGDAPFGNHGDASVRWTEEYQENLYAHQIVMLKRISFLRGTTPWILMDFRSPRRTLPRFEDYFNRKGLVSGRGEKKKAFFVLQKFYQGLKGVEVR
ncbi:MAG TPA: glycoside hydrolase family 2 TIM barrel-domain containing protein [Candidatus Acidoferrum sp.]|nr:glycoside hydrolase family 2 TIM barrel-domain containing protein [Candidatus Acidoferrum sp.]